MDTTNITIDKVKDSTGKEFFLAKSGEKSATGDTEEEALKTLQNSSEGLTIEEITKKVHECSPEEANNVLIELLQDKKQFENLPKNVLYMLGNKILKEKEINTSEKNLYGVQVRSMITAIHHILTFEDKEIANNVANLFSKLEDEKSEEKYNHLQEQLFSLLNKYNLEDIEINYRDVDDNHYGDIEVINANNPADTYEISSRCAQDYSKEDLKRSLRMSSRASEMAEEVLAYISNDALGD